MKSMAEREFWLNDLPATDFVENKKRCSIQPTKQCGADIHFV
jgi:hypothetical protein